MRCITIRQPWATLIALGEKEFETRSWRTAYRGELGIHAGMRIDKRFVNRNRTNQYWRNMAIQRIICRQELLLLQVSSRDVMWLLQRWI